MHGSARPSNPNREARLSVCKERLMREQKKRCVRHDTLPDGKVKGSVCFEKTVSSDDNGKKQIRFIDLFAGCGGLSEGFIQAGYTPVAHVEMDRAACFTLKTRMAYHWLKKNGKLADYCAYLRGEISRDEFYEKIPSQILDSVINEEVGEKTLESLFEKIDAAKGDETIDLIVGGPPCQAYSLVGRARKSMEGNPRNYLFRYYIEFLKHYKPKCFVFENVVGLLSAADKDGNKYLDMMIDGFKDAGYTTSFETINTKTLGIPQARKRVIIIGVRGKKKFKYPKMRGRPFKYTVNEMLDGLPALPAGGIAEPFDIKVSGDTKAALKATGVLDEAIPVTQHQVRPNNANDLEIYKRVVELWNKEHKRLSYDTLPARLQTHTNRKTFKDRFKVVASDEKVCHTVVAHIHKDGHYYIHPDIKQNRSISVREAARLQTFPDNYYFESSSKRPGRAAPYRQIGNAVPVMFAKKIAEAMRGLLK